MDNFKRKFKINQLLIKELGGWVISLRPQQVTIGSLVISLKRKCEFLHEITPEESEELSLVFKLIEKIYTLTFKPEKVNYLALVMVDNQVHFHVIPRYNNSVQFENVIYNDKDYPKPPNVLDSVEFSEQKLLTLKELIISNLDK